jgi:hypothetical protein
MLVFQTLKKLIVVLLFWVYRIIFIASRFETSAMNEGTPKNHNKLLNEHPGIIISYSKIALSLSMIANDPVTGPSE